MIEGPPWQWYLGAALAALFGFSQLALDPVSAYPYLFLAVAAWMGYKGRSAGGTA